MRDCPIFSGTPIISGTRKLRISTFACTFIGSIGTKAHKKFGRSSRGRCQGLLKIFRAPIHRAHLAVIFAIAQLSCSINKNGKNCCYLKRFSTLKFTKMRLRPELWSRPNWGAYDAPPHLLVGSEGGHHPHSSPHRFFRRLESILYRVLWRFDSRRLDTLPR